MTIKELSNKTAAAFGLLYARYSSNMYRTGLYWRFARLGAEPHAIELRSDRLAHQLEFMHEFTPDSTRWYFVIRLARMLSGWGLSIRLTFWALRFQVGPVGIMFPRHQFDQEHVDC